MKENEKHFHEINDSIQIDFKVPESIRELIAEAEQADMNGDLGLYLNLADMIDTDAKNCCADGTLSQRQWDALANRYKQW